MFPTAFAEERPTRSGGINVEESLADNRSETNDSGSSSHVPTSHHPSASQCYGSQLIFTNSDKSVEADRLQPQFRIVQIKAEYQQPNNDVNDQRILELCMIHERKRSSALSGVFNAAKRMRRTSGTVIIPNNGNAIEIDDENDTERQSTLTQRHEETSSASKWSESKICEICKCEIHLSALNHEAKIGNCKSANFDDFMIENNEILKEITEIKQNIDDKMKKTLESTE